jgi:hypothetical protein
VVKGRRRVPTVVKLVFSLFRAKVLQRFKWMPRGNGYEWSNVDKWTKKGSMGLSEDG